MAVSYNGLWKLLIDKNMKKMDLVEKIGISSSTLAKMSKGEAVSMAIMEKICEELKALNIEPCTGSNTQEKNFFEAVEYGCTLFTENDPKSMIEWRKRL